jgi:phosphoglucomutase
MQISPLAGHTTPPAMLLDVSRLVTAYYTGIPDPSVPAQRVAFGTSGHRGSAFETSFNEWHVFAISEAICRHRRRQGIDGPLFRGKDQLDRIIEEAQAILDTALGKGMQ